MPATYPLAVRTFTQKRNLLDDVEASHINDMQSEIAALETAVGIRPNVSALTGTVYGTVNDRISAVERSDQTNVFAVTQTTKFSAASGSWVAPTAGVGPSASIVALSPSLDPDGLSNGTGVTIKRAGYYAINFYAQFGESPVKGRRICALAASNNATQPYHRLTYFDAPHDATATSFSDGMGHGFLTTYVAAGTRLALSLFIDNSLTQTGKVSVYSANLQGHLLRG